MYKYHSKTLSPRSLKKLNRGESVEDNYDRPKTRSECGDERPCPFVGCRYHLYLDVHIKGSIKFNFPDTEPEDMLVSCALDVADECQEGLTCDDIAALLNITRQGVAMIEQSIMPRVRRALKDYKNE
jgi:hypothetical protein